MMKLSLTDLASEGERLCKSGDCVNGIKHFEAALEAYNQQIEEKNLNETEQVKLEHTLAIIYNQLGNAYFNLQDYVKALEYHKKDLELSEKFGDECGKAKACGNVGNTLQLLGDHDQAILYLLRNLEISKNLNDTNGEARALYNLANIYQAKGKFMGRLTYHDNSRDPNSGEFNNEIREVLMKAVYYYKETLRLVSSKDRAAEGRTYGNLGNTYYFLGDFESAIECHHQRLKIAKEYGDKPAERRAYSNLGNAHIFQGRFNEAADFYLKAMNVARTLGDRAIEAQSYYSLGNAYILLQDYSVAIDFHLRHLQIAQSLEDKIGESRAYWSLGNAYAALGDLDNAIMYANRHLSIARMIGDTTSELTAKKNLYDFQSLLNNSGFRDSESGLFTPVSSKYGRKYLDQPNSLQKSVSIDSFYTNTAVDHIPPLRANNSISNGKNLNFSMTNSEPDQNKKEDQDMSFLDILSRMQSNRLDDQRCSIKSKSSNGLTRIEQQTTDTGAKGKENKENSGSQMPTEDFFNLIVKTQQNRLQDQRSHLATPKLKKHDTESQINGMSTLSSTKSKFKALKQAITVPPNDEFFSMIQKIQSRRLDEQRSNTKLKLKLKKF